MLVNIHYSEITIIIKKFDKMANHNVKMPRIDSWCRTRAAAGEEVKFTFAWTIERFSERPERNCHNLLSNIFTVPGPDNQSADWRIELYPKGAEEDIDNFLSVNLNYESHSEVQAKCEFSILDADKTKQNNRSISKFVVYKEFDGDGFDKFISIDSLKSQSAQLLPDDNLTFLCEVTVLFRTESKISSVIKEDDVKLVHLSQENLQEDLEIAFSHKEFTDVKIHCGDKMFDCHQVILAARSPVFRAMFKAEMAEKKTQRVDIKDLHPDVFSEMLTFIYTGKIPNVDRLAEELIEAADKYQVEFLKTICSEKLCKSINVNNCFKYLVMGDIYQTEALKKYSLKYISENVASVCNTGEWRNGLLNHPNLMADVIEAFGRNQTSGNNINGS